MIENRLNWEYYILGFIPDVLSDKSIPLGILLRAVVTASAEPRLRFARAKFVDELQGSSVAAIEADQALIKEAITEITAVTNRAHSTGQGNELDALLQQLLNASSGLCAFAYPWRVVGDPEVELQALFNRFICPQ